MPRILITGSGGIIGGHVRQRLGSGSDPIDIVRFKGDLANLAETQAALDAAGPLDSVIHLGAMVPVNAVQADPARAYDVNVGGTVHLLGALAHSGQTPHVFYCSSGHVYAPQPTAISEDAATEPVSLYGRTKWMAEFAAKDICAAHDIPLCIGRVFSIHDPAQTGPYLRPNIAKRLAQENLSQPFELPGADSIRDFLTAEQAARIIVRLVLARYIGVINIGSGQPTRIRDFVQSLAPGTLDIRHVGTQDCLLADTTRLAAFLEGQDA